MQAVVPPRTRRRPAQRAPVPRPVAMGRAHVAPVEPSARRADPATEPAYIPYVGPPLRGHDRRLRALGWLWLVAALAIVVRLVDIQIVRADRFAARAVGQQERHIVLEARRGRVADRNGIDLAVSLPAASVAMNPKKVGDKSALARRIARITGEPAGQILRRISVSGRAFAWIARNVSREEARRLEALAPGAMMVLSGTRRAHPLGALAGQVLGHVDIDNVGGDGIEAAYHDELRGRDGWVRSLVDAHGERVPNTAQPVEQPVHGTSLVLGLDADYQAIVEHELALAVEESRATSGTAVLYDASTGAVRALANVPQYDPDRYRAVNPALRRDRIITDPYEPGSMFKAITAAAALAEGVVKPEEIIDCENGLIVVGGQVIRDSHKNGAISFRDVVALSSNVGTIKVAKRIEPDTFYRYIRSFGFAAETGIDLPGESKGILARRSQWSGRSQATIAIGQEIGVTAIQVAAAYGALANGGWLMRPHLVERLVALGGRIVETVEPQRVRQVVSQAVADSVVNLLCGVVEEGTGTTAKIAGLRVAGKTGTAQIAAPDGRGYEPGAYIASFAGFLPEMTPRLVCVVSITRPQTSHYGSAVAGPVFRRIMSRIVSKDAVVLAPSDSAIGAMMPDLAGLEPERAQAVLDSLGAAVRIVGEGGAVVAQWPPASARIPVDGEVELVLANRIEHGPRIPDVRGRTIRQAVAVMSAAGIAVRLEGSGIVYEQVPAAGSRPPETGAVLLRSRRRDADEPVRRTE